MYTLDSEPSSTLIDAADVNAGMELFTPGLPDAMLGTGSKKHPAMVLVNTIALVSIEKRFNARPFAWLCFIRHSAHTVSTGV
jgi:hypothetical protein